MMVEKLDVDPKACVYLDDLGVNLKPAREMGMTTVKVGNAAQGIAELPGGTGGKRGRTRGLLRGLGGGPRRLSGSRSKSEADPLVRRPRWRGASDATR